MQEPNMNDIKRRIAHRIRTQREINGLGQEQLAKELEIGARTYIRYETGEASPKLDTFLVICDHLHLDPAQVIADAKRPPRR